MNDETTIEAPKNQTRKARLVVVETIYHQMPDGQPIDVSIRHSQLLESTEQPFQRRFTVGTECIKLPLGWFKDDDGNILPCSMLVIENRGMDLPQGQLTAAQKIESDSRVLEYALCMNERFEPMDAVLSGKSIRTCPTDLSRIMLRCRKGTTNVTVTIFPA